MTRNLTRLTFIMLVTAFAVVIAACGGATQQAAAPTVAAPTTAAAAPTTAPAAAPKATEASKAAAPAAPGACNYDYRVTAIGPNEAKQLTGAGATFPQNLYTRWFSDYNKLTGVQVNYQGVGSSAGIRQISEQTVDFGASDAPMTADQEKAAKGGALFHIPTAAGAVVLTYNVAGASQPLKLTSDIVAGVYLGTIKTWNDPKIAAENAGVTLPSANIIVVRRSDGSGTTNAFTEWLSVTNAEWKQKVGQGTTVNWPVGIGAQGNAGVAGEVKNNPNSIGYVEEIFASQNKLPKALIKNKAGKFIEPNLETVTAALDASLKTIPPDLKFSIIDAAGDNSYPISTPTWVLAYENMTDQAKAAALARVLWWGLTDGEKINKEMGFAPLPLGMVKLAQDKICSIKVNGQAVFTGK